jgi:hypothetical protein
MLPSAEYSIEAIKDVAKRMVRGGQLGYQQRIYSLCCHFPLSEWNEVECELERNDFLLRDRIIDLLGGDCWLDD